jgi:hypothetical protein
VWTGLVWLRIGTRGELLWIRWRTFGFHKMVRNCRVPSQLMTIELVSSLVSRAWENTGRSLVMTDRVPVERFGGEVYLKYGIKKVNCGIATITWSRKQTQTQQLHCNRRSRFLLGTWRYVTSRAELVRGQLRFSFCKLWLLELTVRDHRRKGTFAVGSRYQATASEECIRMKRHIGLDCSGSG